ncbi:adenosine receptor A3-like [Pocillopora damicornis]|uniref:adenosine receptor A3-like n=1 Tax=Pocillopora damicornis TaxID=46731 RepID=UPI000F559638|nr:adenosine receptor A3-like [Pocillopora damicornis]
MDEVYCDELLQHYPSFSDFQDLRFTYICNCVFNILLAQNTIVSNMLAIIAIRRCSSLPQTLKTFLLSLSASDVGIGLVVQPIHISLLINWLQQNDSNCIIAMVYQMCGTFFSLTSFLGVLAISVDRFLAIHLHLRYKELVTHRRVVAVVVSIWLFSAFVDHHGNFKKELTSCNDALPIPPVLGLILHGEVKKLPGFMFFANIRLTVPIRRQRGTNMFIDRKCHDSF